MAHQHKQPTNYWILYADSLHSYIKKIYKKKGKKPEKEEMHKNNKANNL